MHNQRPGVGLEVIACDGQRRTHVTLRSDDVLWCRIRQKVTCDPVSLYAGSQFRGAASVKIFPSGT